MLTQPLPLSGVSEFASEARAALTKPGQRELPSKYLYDEVGSALFEAICLLPEYGLSRAGARLLKKYAPEIVGKMPAPVHVAELGSGSGKKTRWILEEFAERQLVYYYPIEISPAALAACEKELGELDFLSIVGYEKPYLEGLRAVAKRRRGSEHLCVLFLGSTIGNFDRPAGDLFLREVRQILLPGDSLLLATDLEKDVDVQLLAYDDPAGVTAAFNLNLLGRLNRELGADFDLSAFRHEALWNASDRRIEMHLRSLRRQRVEIPAARLSFRLEEDETIWTESSHKYSRNEPLEMARRTGFHCVGQWFDEEWPYAQNLWLVEESDALSETLDAPDEPR
ncbi:MAG TPA: L-histidine N(alpha)-methyltransferase [Candidatus Acidoferrum sp.]|nr:L-histidine N(alpha)-methyltransferase [Candidatus Acidoferrum sp.]